MAGLAAGDAAMEIALVYEFGSELAATVVALARADGLRAPHGEDLDGLVLDAAAEVAGIAGAWDPAKGALPWTFAKHRIRGALHRWTGPTTCLFDEETHTPPPPPPAWSGPEGQACATLRRLAGLGHRCSLVQEALDRVVRPADHELLLRWHEQVASGDPSPANTVGVEVGRSPAAVRQAVRRARVALEQLIAEDPRFAALAGLPLLERQAQRRPAAGLEAAA